MTKELDGGQGGGGEGGDRAEGRESRRFRWRCVLAYFCAKLSLR